jgi:hypothetical protein
MNARNALRPCRSHWSLPSTLDNMVRLPDSGYTSYARKETSEPSADGEYCAMPCCAVLYIRSPFPVGSCTAICIHILPVPVWRTNHALDDPC